MITLTVFSSELPLLTIEHKNTLEYLWSNKKISLLPLKLECYCRKKDMSSLPCKPVEIVEKYGNMAFFLPFSSRSYTDAAKGGNLSFTQNLRYKKL